MQRDGLASARVGVAAALLAPLLAALAIVVPAAA
jgi:hypothetical protein